MSTSVLSKNLTNERAFETVCKLKNNDELKTSDLLNIDSTENAFINKKFA